MRLISRSRCTTSTSFDRRRSASARSGAGAGDRPLLAGISAEREIARAQQRDPEESGGAVALSRVSLSRGVHPGVPVGRESAARDWKAKYYLSLVYWGCDGRRSPRSAERMWRPAGLRTAYVCRAWLEKGSNPVKALADLEKARTVDPKDWRNWFHLASYYDESARPTRRLQSPWKLEAISDEDLVKILLARTYLNGAAIASAMPCWRTPQSSPSRTARRA